MIYVCFEVLQEDDKSCSWSFGPFFNNSSLWFCIVNITTFFFKFEIGKAFYSVRLNMRTRHTTCYKRWLRLTWGEVPLLVCRSSHRASVMVVTSEHSLLMMSRSPGRARSATACACSRIWRTDFSPTPPLSASGSYTNQTPCTLRFNIATDTSAAKLPRQSLVWRLLVRFNSATDTISWTVCQRVHEKVSWFMLCFVRFKRYKSLKYSLICSEYKLVQLCAHWFKG